MELKLKPEIKQLWLEGLRSGDFSQCPGKLSDGTGYCCLGVLSELAVREGVAMKEDEPYEVNLPYPSEGVRIEHQVTYDGSLNYLPKSVAEWAFEPFDAYQVNYENPRVNEVRPETDVNYGGPTTTLSELNDDGFTFEQIADVIEEQL